MRVEGDTLSVDIVISVCFVIIGDMPNDTVMGFAPRIPDSLDQ